MSSPSRRLTIEIIRCWYTAPQSVNRPLATACTASRWQGDWCLFRLCGAWGSPRCWPSRSQALAQDRERGFVQPEYAVVVFVFPCCVLAVGRLISEAFVEAACPGIVVFDAERGEGPAPGADALFANADEHRGDAQALQRAHGGQL